MIRNSNDLWYYKELKEKQKLTKTCWVNAKNPYITNEKQRLLSHSYIDNPAYMDYPIHSIFTKKSWPLFYFSFSPHFLLVRSMPHSEETIRISGIGSYLKNLLKVAEKGIHTPRNCE